MPRGPKTKPNPQLDAFFTAAPAGLAIVDRELRYVQLNETLAAMNGVSVQAHLGRPLREVLPALAPLVEPILQQILATGQPALNIEVIGETPAQPGATRHWMASYFPLPGRGGRPAGIGAIVVEDTERRRAEEAWRRSGAEFQAIVEQATYGIYRSSVDGQLKRVNPALVRMLGYDSEAEVLALDLARDVYVEPAERDRLIEQYRAAQVIKGVEAEWKRRDGHHILVRLSGRPLRGEGAELIGFSMLAEDVTEQRTLERALQQAQKMETIGQLTGGIAHDFNNLLTVVLANARFIADALPPDRHDLRREVEELRGAALRGADLVHKLLGFSRHQTLELQPVALDQRVQEVLDVLRRLLPSNVTVEFAAEPDAGMARADRGAVEQILMNLATNAGDAMPQGGTLHVAVRRAHLDEEDRPLHAWIQPGPFVCVAVSDTGAGMDAQTLARVFEPFFTTKPPGVGTGLGLSMVYGLMKQHNGFVHFYSEPGQGTTAKLYFPRAETEEQQAQTRRRENVLAGGTERILLVEDDPRLRNVAARLLKKFGYEVLVAADGAEGLELYRARREELDLVMTDLMMPKLGGVELYEALRREGGPVKVLFTSGYPEQQLDDEARRDVAVGFVTKPWTAAELLGQVRGLLDRPAGGSRVPELLS